MTEKKKFVVTYGRTVQTRPYESMKVQLLVEHYVDDISLDDAFKEARDRVEGWIKLEMVKNGEN